VEFLMVLLVSSSVFQQVPAARPAADSVRAVPTSVAGVPAASPAPWLPGHPEPSDSASPGPVERPVLSPLRPDFYGVEPAPQRPRAVEYSEAYHVRLAIHQIASYATLPLFVAEYLLGRKLMTSPTVSQSTRQAHQTVALGVAGLFGVNTVTGAWNLWEGRKSPQGRLRRYLHSGLMMLADAGFVATGLTAPHHRRLSGFQPTTSQRNLHQAVAIASMSTALVSYGMMLIWKD
jgi:hypothetical protein